MSTNFQKVVDATFSNQIERNVFRSQLGEVLQGSGLTWYWYGTGNNGKTTLMNALVNEFKATRLPPEEDSEEVYSLNGNKLKITNIEPECEPPTMVTEFTRQY